MRQLLTFLKTQNPRREGQGLAGGWLEARRRWSRCQAKDPLDPNAVPGFLQAHLLSIRRALCTTPGSRSSPTTGDSRIEPLVQAEQDGSPHAENPDSRDFSACLTFRRNRRSAWPRMDAMVSRLSPYLRPRAVFVISGCSFA